MTHIKCVCILCWDRLPSKVRIFLVRIEVAVAAEAISHNVKSERFANS